MANNETVLGSFSNPTGIDLLDIVTPGGGVAWRLSQSQVPWFQGYGPPTFAGVPAALPLNYYIDQSNQNVYELDVTGTVWNLIGSLVSTNDVTSVFGRTGAITAQTGDYSFSQISGSVGIAQIGASGSPSSSNYLRGDGSWSVPGGSGISSPVTTAAGNPFIFNTDLQFGGAPNGGANPYLDVRSYGVRAVLPNSAPATGLTCNTTATNPVVSLSSASSFVNGDGVILYAAGATHSLTTPSAPTVTTALPAGLAGSGYTVAGLTGSTTYTYSIVARNSAGGLTQASSTATLTTGPASLGPQNVSISSASRSNATTTYTTSSAHGLAVGAVCYVSGFTDNTFNGWFTVASVPDTSHFTITSAQDTRNGANTSASAGSPQVDWWNCNKIVLPAATTGVIQYFIYGRTSGSMALIGVSTPIVSGQTDPSYLVYEDYGSTMSGNVSLPTWVPSTPPGSATPNNLVTTILSGAGTTSITLAAAPSQTLTGTSNTGTTIRFDNGPNLIAAFAAASNSGGGAKLYFPATATFGQSYVIQSYTDLSSYGIRGVLQAGPITLNDTVKLPTAIQWKGDNSIMNEPQFGIAAHVPIFVNNANPGFFSATCNLDGLNFQATGNCFNSIFLTGEIPTGTIENCSFVGSNSTDLMGIHVYCFAQYSAGGAAGLYFRNVLFSSGCAQVDGSTCAPNVIFKNTGETSFDGVMQNRRGILWIPNAAGQTVEYNQRYECQGNIMPQLTFFFTGGGASGWVNASGMICDTSPHSPLCHLGGGYIPQIVRVSGTLPGNQGVVTGFGFDNLEVHGATSPVYGQNVNILSSTIAAMGDGIFASGGNGANQGLLNIQKHVTLGQSNVLFTSASQPAAPTAVVTTGGPPYSKAVTNGVYTYCGIYPGGGFGPQSAASNAVTTDGATQISTITIAAPISGATGGYAWYGNGILMGTTNASTLTFVAPNIYVGAGTLVASSGSTGMRGTNLWTQNFQITPTLFANLGSPQNGSLYFCGDCTAASSPCTGSGSGTFAFRRNGSWVCL
jgi:hypothetical protein